MRSGERDEHGEQGERGEHDGVGGRDGHDGSGGPDGPGGHRDPELRDPELRDTARKVLDLLSEDPDAPSPVARRLREVLLEGLPAEQVGVVAAFERAPFAPAAALALEAVLRERAAADPEFAVRVRALLRGELGSGGDADARWAERYGGRPLSAVWFLIAAVVALMVLNAFAACSGPVPDMP
ncbi:hypothetical protein ACFYM0_09290 [Streptomyces sp. NPDC006487]|uniref:hypothetical protein n=1 Tax=Streptomyces sp. NPDC006487 TaxID=3364748 RepID=UPI0036D170B7